MIDITLIRENKELVKENIKKKFQDHKLPLVDEVYDLDIQFREAKQEADQLRAEKNKKSAEIGLLMRDGKKDEAEKIKNEVAKTNDRIAELEEKEVNLEAEIIKKCYYFSYRCWSTNCFKYTKYSNRKVLDTK